jgi:hypothetical protein
VDRAVSPRPAAMSRQRRIPHVIVSTFAVASTCQHAIGCSALERWLGPDPALAEKTGSAKPVPAHTRILVMTCVLLGCWSKNSGYDFRKGATIGGTG